jgi:hypothetical protein
MINPIFCACTVLHQTLNIPFMNSEDPLPQLSSDIYVSITRHLDQTEIRLTQSPNSPLKEEEKKG